MNRQEALLFLKPRFDSLMLGAGRGCADDPDGYGPALDAAFQRYLISEGLSGNVMTTVVANEDTPGFCALLTAYTYDLLLPLYAVMADVSVDAPLTNVKFSQVYRQLKDLRDQAWQDASDYGYLADINADGFVLTLTHNEPCDSYSREFG